MNSEQATEVSEAGLAAKTKSPLFGEPFRRIVVRHQTYGICLLGQ